MMETIAPSARFLNASQVRERYGNISDMTLWRWLRDEAMRFPEPTVINRRRLWNESDLAQFDQSKAPA